MKAHFNHLLELQKSKVHHYESQVASVKLTYAEALRNLEQISDEIHQNRRKASLVPPPGPPNKQLSLDSNESLLEDAQELVDEYKSLPATIGVTTAPIISPIDEVEGYKNVNLSPLSPMAHLSQSGEWTEINLDSPPSDVSSDAIGEERPRLVRQKTLPNPNTQSEIVGGFKGKLKLDSSITNWISRSSVKDDGCFGTGK